MVRSDLKGHGLGHRLMEEMLAGARLRGLSAVEGDVLAENTTMLTMAKALGGVVEASTDARIVRVRFPLAITET